MLMKGMEIGRHISVELPPLSTQYQTGPVNETNDGGCGGDGGGFLLFRRRLRSLPTIVFPVVGLYSKSVSPPLLLLLSFDSSGDEKINEI